MPRHLPPQHIEPLPKPLDARPPQRLNPRPQTGPHHKQLPPTPKLPNPPKPRNGPPLHTQKTHTPEATTPAMSPTKTNPVPPNTLQVPIRPTQLTHLHPTHSPTQLTHAGRTARSYVVPSAPGSTRPSFAGCALGDHWGGYPHGAASPCGWVPLGGRRSGLTCCVG
ncbi:hypothetical protein GCM10009554_27760 [Kribbella koreensis]|uniref:Uncharacterized protein n=1 Tax=Kribbella koreensis TaxID=57909 RepID=A0ABN1Q7B3_9ACTN